MVHVPRLLIGSIVGLMALVTTTGCDDEHTIISSGPGEDAGYIDPDDRPDPDAPDMDVDGRMPTPDAGDGDGGQGNGDGTEIFEDAAPSQDPDADPDDWQPNQNPEEDPDLAIGDDEPEGEEDRMVEQDPDALPMPRCGTFGPGRAIEAGPAVARTYLFGGPGIRFDEPALAGCTPGALWGGDPDRFFQAMTFDYRWDRVLEWTWDLLTPDGGTHMENWADYDGLGRVVEAEVRCVWSVQHQVFSFRYDPEGRLMQEVIERPAQCGHAGQSPETRTVTWRYAAGRLPIGRTIESRLPDGVARVSVDFDYERDADGRLLAIHEHRPAGMPGETRSFEYDEHGQLIRQIVELMDLGPRQQQITDYDYDDRGRLTGRISDTGVLLVEYDAEGALFEVTHTNSATVRQLGFPEEQLFERDEWEDDEPDEPPRFDPEPR